MNVNYSQHIYSVYTILILISIGVSLILLVFRKDIKNSFNQLSNKPNEQLTTNSLIEFEKSWNVGELVLGNLSIKVGGRTLKECDEYLGKVLDRSRNHDSECLHKTNKWNDESIG